ncbi:MAG: hypothetical protein Q4D71_07970 [Oscillospiraceae bacterium]|nr:hypothetical protein [Oscillospiraceae bacterium]
MIKSAAKKAFILCLCCALILCACGNAEEQKKNDMKKIILENMEKIDEVSDPVSSNPYDYTKNEYYRNIVDLGKDAVPVLEEMYLGGELTGLHAFVSAIAISEITDSDIEFSTADEFFTKWIGR